MASRDLKLSADILALSKGSETSAVVVLLSAARTLVERLAMNPLLATGVGATLYVSQFWIRKRIAAAIFLIRTYQKRGHLDGSPAVSEEPTAEALEDDWSPRREKPLTLADLDPTDIRHYVETIGVDPRTDTALVERTIAEVLQPTPPRGWELHRTAYHGLRFVDLSTGEVHIAHPDCVDVVEDIRQAALALHGGLKAVRPTGSWRTSTIDQDRIFRKFYSEAELDGHETPRGRTREKSRERESTAAGWATQSLRAAVTSIRDIVKTSVRPEVLKEAAVVAADTSPARSPVPPPPPPPPPKATGVPPPPPPPPKAKAAPPPPPVAKSPSADGNDRDRLLQAIRSGVPLKPVADAAPAAAVPQDPRDQLLDDIRKGVRLNHVETKGDKRTAAPRALPPPQNVQEELQRKFGKKKAPEKSDDSW